MAEVYVVVGHIYTFWPNASLHTEDYGGTGASIHEDSWMVGWCADQMEAEAITARLDPLADKFSLAVLPEYATARADLIAEDPKLIEPLVRLESGGYEDLAVNYEILSGEQKRG